MTRMMIATLALVALAVAACSGSAETTSEPSDATTVATAGQAEVAEAATELVTDLGSETAALDALIIAMDRGYSAGQILDAVDMATLRSDGTIDAQAPEGPALGLVLYQVAESVGEGEGAFGPLRPAGPGEVTLVRHFQVEKTPIEQMRQRASGTIYGVGNEGAAFVLALLRAGFQPEDVVEVLILGSDRSTFFPEDGEDQIFCLVVVDELVCEGGERYPAPIDTDTPQTEETPTPAEAVARDRQLRWEGDMTANPEWVDNPVAGTFLMTRSAGTDQFQVQATTADAKSGTYTTDGFDSVECDTEWTSTFEGTGTFWDRNNQRIEFEGQITRSIVYTAGPCTATPEPSTADFSGVVVSITETGIEFSFNAWEITLDGPPPLPIDS